MWEVCRADVGHPQPHKGRLDGRGAAVEKRSDAGLGPVLRSYQCGSPLSSILEPLRLVDEEPSGRAANREVANIPEVYDAAQTYRSRVLDAGWPFENSVKQLLHGIVFDLYIAI